MTMNSFKTLLPLAVVTAIALSFAVQPASADPLSLTIGNSGLAGYNGPFANVTINLTDSTHAAITFTALDGTDSHGNIVHYLMGGQGAVGLNVNGTVAVSPNPPTAPTGPQDGAAAPQLTVAGAGNEDGFGNFNWTLDNFDGFSHAFRTISFTLINISGTWSSASNILTPNNGAINAGGPFEAAAHIYVAAADYSNTMDTGYAGNG